MNGLSESFGESSQIFRLVEEKAAVSGHASKDWLDTLQGCAPDLLDTLCTQEAVRRIVDSCASPTQLVLITEALTGGAGATPATIDAWGELIRRVDHSPYTLADWIAALEAFTQWVKKKGRSADFISLLGYLDCCIEYIPETSPKILFPKLVCTFLDEFGYEG